MVDLWPSSSFAPNMMKIFIGPMRIATTGSRYLLAAFAAFRVAHPRRGRVMPVVVETAEAVLLVPPAQPPHGTRADPQHLRDLNPRLPPVERLHEDLMDLHGPLHRSMGIGHPHLLGGDDNPAACLLGAVRSFALGSGQIMCSPQGLTLTRVAAHLSLTSEMTASV